MWYLLRAWKSCVKAISTARYPLKTFSQTHGLHSSWFRKVSFWISGKRCLSACYIPYDLAVIVIVDQMSKAKVPPGPDGTVQVKLSHDTLPRVTTTNQGTKGLIECNHCPQISRWNGACWVRFLDCKLQRMPVCLRKWPSYQYLTVPTLHSLSFLRSSG